MVVAMLQVTTFFFYFQRLHSASVMFNLETEKNLLPLDIVPTSIQDEEKSPEPWSLWIVSLLWKPPMKNVPALSDIMAAPNVAAGKAAPVPQVRVDKLNISVLFSVPSWFLIRPPATMIRSPAFNPHEWNLLGVDMFASLTKPALSLNRYAASHSIPPDLPPARNAWEELILTRQWPNKMGMMCQFNILTCNPHSSHKGNRRSNEGASTHGMPLSKRWQSVLISGPCLPPHRTILLYVQAKTDPRILPRGCAGGEHLAVELKDILSQTHDQL